VPHCATSAGAVPALVDPENLSRFGYVTEVLHHSVMESDSGGSVPMDLGFGSRKSEKRTTKTNIKIYFGKVDVYFGEL
jgi:hypothetical protein